MSEPNPNSAIAIVGMAGRFPGAPDVDALWNLVRDGEAGLCDLTDAQLLAAGLDPSLLADRDYVRRAGMLADVEGFDAAFFGIGAGDAAVMDPQHRHFYECAWAALESAGHVPERFDGAIGVFGGCGHNSYLLHNLLTSPGLLDRLGWFLLRHTANDKDFLTTGVSYRLGLQGPSVNVQTACSTSLVAVHLAVQSLLGLECDMALAGGATIQFPHTSGYRFHEGEILAPDGHCRAFDERSEGTVLTSGVGVVALRRLVDALADGDPVLAVIRGSAINNDGSRKVGYLAPSVDGHAAVVREALAVANVDPRTVSLLEAHGTGTRVGDPIEVAALTAAFRDSTGDTGFCRLASTKPNLGHLDTAAGVASLIKVVQALRHQWLPPMAGFTAPNPLLDIERTPFTVSGTGAPWTTDGAPRRAGVSSLGVGGTNAHVIVDEAPPVEASDAAPGPHLLLVSARTETAVEHASGRLATHIAAGGGGELGDVAHTLAVGRRPFAHRRAVVALGVPDAVSRLRGDEPARRYQGEAADRPREVIFCFPGGGSQYAGMAGGLITADARFAVFQSVLGEAIEEVHHRSGIDVRPLLAGGRDHERHDVALRQPRVSLPAVFSVEVALARQLLAWGVRPRALVGHSLGEYAAAHLAGVLSLGDVIELVVRRAELVERVTAAGGAMATVSLGEADLVPHLGPDVSLAVVNTVDECVVSGRAEAVGALLARLTAAGVDTHPIPLAAAGHSALLDPVLPEFAAVARGATFNRPTLPYVSNLTGTWITPEQATDPDAWVRHLRGTVRFADGLAAALAEGPAAVVEVGPGRTLTSYARRQPSRPIAIATLGHVNDNATPDDVHLLGALGQLWTAGVEADWPGLVTTPGRRRRVPLPTYPFERTRHWIEPGVGPASAVAGTSAASAPVGASEPNVRRPLEQWAGAPVWSALPSLAAPSLPPGRWLVVADGPDTIAPRLAGALAGLGAAVEVVPSGLAAGAAAGADAVVVVVAATPARSPEDMLAVAQRRWLGTAIDVVRAVSERDRARVGLVTAGAWTLPGDAPGRAADALAVGPATVARAEYPNVRSSAIDLPAEPTADDIAAAAAELVAGNEPLVALRAGQRHGMTVEAAVLAPVPVAPPPIRPGGTWLVTGGLGAVGNAVARRLAARGCALVLTASSPLPGDAADWRRQHGPRHPTTVRLDRLDRLEARRADGAPARVEVCDTADPAAVRSLFARLAADDVHLDGVVHAAGVLADRPLAVLASDEVDAVVGAKARGALVLADELAGHGGGTLVLASSTSTLLAPPGQTSYVAANSVLDALAGDRGDVRVVTVQWGLWAGEGMAATAADSAGMVESRLLDHPVLHEVATDRAGALHVRGALTTGVWTIDQHRLPDGTALLPGTGAIELLLAALAAGGEAAAEVRDLTLLAPLVVPDGSIVPVRVFVDPPGRPARMIRLDATPAGDGAWRTFVEATVSDGAAVAPARSLPSDPVERARRFPEPVGDLLAGPDSQLRLGARWHVTTVAGRGTGELLATVEPPGDSDGWRFDPAVADLAIAAGVALLPATGLWVPATIESAGVTGADAPARLVYACCREGLTADSDTAVIDVLVAAADGAPLVYIDGLVLRRLDAGAGFAHGELPPPLTDDRRHLSGSLGALARSGGITPDEGGEAFERVLGSGAHRLVVSSVALSAGVEPGPVEATATTRPRGTLETVIVQWQELLGVDPIGPDDDFFELGGHSLIAVRIVAGIHRRLGVRLPLTALVEAPTPAKLAAAIDAVLLETGAAAAETLPASARAAVATTPRPLVPLRPAGGKRPFFIIHGAGGSVLNLQGLARSLAPDRPVWGLQAHGNDGTEAPDPTIEAMAARYLDAVRHVQPEGPYLLGGYSGGGIVALEMSRQAAAVGARVDLVVMFDTFRPVASQRTRTEKLRNLVGNARSHGLRSTVTADWLQKAARRRLARIGLVSSVARSELDLCSEFERAVIPYHFSLYPTDVVLLRAARVHPTMMQDYCWSSSITGRFVEHEVAGDHNSLLAREHLPTIASLVSEALDTTDGR